MWKLPYVANNYRRKTTLTMVFQTHSISFVLFFQDTTFQKDSETIKMCLML